MKVRNGSIGVDITLGGKDGVDWEVGVAGRGSVSGRCSLSLLSTGPSPNMLLLLVVVVVLLLVVVVLLSLRFNQPTG